MFLYDQRALTIQQQSSSQLTNVNETTCESLPGLVAEEMGLQTDASNEMKEL